MYKRSNQSRENNALRLAVELESSETECIGNLHSDGDMRGVQTLICTSDGKFLFSGSLDRMIRKWDLHKMTLLREWQAHNDGVLSMDLSSDGSMIISSSVGDSKKGTDQPIKLWNSDTLQCLRGWTDVTSGVPCVRFNQQSTLIVACSMDNIIRVWRVSDGECVRRLNAPEKGCYSVCFLNKWVLFGSKSRLCAWQYRQITEEEHPMRYVSVLNKHHHRAIHGLAVNHDQSMLASASRDHSIILWKVSDWTKHSTLKGHSGGVMSVQFDPSHQEWLASVSNDKTVRVWSISDGVCLHTFHGHTRFVQSLRYSMDGTRLFTGSWDSSILVWNLDRRLPPHALHTVLEYWVRLNEITLFPSDLVGLLDVWVHPYHHTA